MTVLKAHRYRLASATQKLVRRGDAEGAARVAVELLQSTSIGYVVHRVSETLIEDRWGQPVEASELILWARSGELGGVELAREMARRAAGLVGCRVADALWLSAESPEIASITAGMMRTLSRSDAVEVVADTSRHWTERLAALKTFEAGKGVYESAIAMGLSEPIVLVSRLVRPNSLIEMAGLASSIVLASDGELLVDQIEPGLEVASLPSSSYDSHVGEGKRAIGYWRASVDALRQFFDARPHIKRGEALGWSVFTVEGARSNVTLTSPLIQEIEQHARATFVAQLGLSMADFELLEKLTLEHLPKLHAARAKIVGQIDEAQALKDSAQSDLKLPLSPPS